MSQLASLCLSTLHQTLLVLFCVFFVQQSVFPPINFLRSEQSNFLTLTLCSYVSNTLILQSCPNKFYFPSPMEPFLTNYDVNNRKLYTFLYTPLYENKQNVREIIQWRLLFAIPRKKRKESKKIDLYCFFSEFPIKIPFHVSNMCPDNIGFQSLPTLIAL